MLLKAVSFCWMANCLSAQVIVSLELVTSGTAGIVGTGKEAYAWNMLVCSVPPGNPVPMQLIRIEFPEVRLYSVEQQSEILAARVAHSPAAVALRVGGYVTASAGLALTIEKTLRKSPSQLGTVVTVGGLAVPLLQSLLTKQLPSYRIPNPAPAVVQLPVGGCNEYTMLAAYGKAAVVIGPRRVNPLTILP